uniref:I/LWEQ domain-containing protein n=1 Tax=Elaeophora elaphi TaxID=1147741 RepID=A0A0R3RIF2_9BILA
DDIAKKLIEIEKKDQSLIEEDRIKDEKEVVISDIARRIVEALTSNHVLGKVLTTEEATILRDYFSRKIPLSEKVLATLDTALDKILCRAHEFYDDKMELDAFLKDRDSAKAKLLDALIAKKSNYLADLMTDASFYADRISKGLIDAYKLATEGILVARDNLQYMQAAVSHTYRYSKQMAYRGATLTYETAARGKELAEIGASVSAQMTSDAAKMALDAAVRGKELAERGAAIGTKMTSDAAKMTYNVTNRSKELAELGVAIGTKMTQDAASKGLQIAEGTIHVASKGTEMVKDSLTAASNTTLNLSETAVESAVQATKLVSEKVQNFTGAMNQAKTGIHLHDF